MHSHPVLGQQGAPKREYHILVEDDVIEVEVESETIINFGTDFILEPLPEPELDESLDGITAIVVNYQTKNLIKTAVESFREFYPDMSLIIVDNASTDGSKEWLLDNQDAATAIILNSENEGHGPALHRAILRATTEFVFTFDSDVEFLHPGLLEQMLGQIGDAYAIGWLRWVNRNGVSIAKGEIPDKNKLCPYIHPHCALYRKSIYLTLTPFVNKGAPARINMQDAKARGLKLVPFATDIYVDHLIAGTRRMWNGHWNPKGKGSKWNADRIFPI